MLKNNFEDTVASPPGPLGWCPLFGTMLGPQCLLLIQLRIIFVPQIVSILLKRIGPCAVIVIVLSSFASHFLPLRTPFSWWYSVRMFLCIVDARPEGWSFRFVVDLSFLRIIAFLPYHLPAPFRAHRSLATLTLLVRLWSWPLFSQSPRRAREA